MYEFITAAEKAQAEKILGTLGTMIHLGLLDDNYEAAKAEHEGKKDVHERLRGYLWGKLEILEQLGKITFEEEDVLTRYFIDREVEMETKWKNPGKA